MIAVDTNILVYAHREDSPWHAAALVAMRELAEGNRSWAIPWPAAHEFISIVTHPRIYRPASPLTAALDSISVWLSSPSCRTLSEGPSYFAAFRKLALQAKISGPMAHDARIAALCLDNAVTELWTADRDFSRFGALKCRNPLIG